MKRLATAPSSRLVRIDIEQIRLMTRIARLHFLQGLRQADIAEKLGISQASVSRYLTLAEEQGIVRTVVVSPDGLFPELEEGLVESYGLQSAYVIDISSSEEGVSHVLGTAAAQCLSSEFKESPLVGFTSWSTTLREMAKAMLPRSTGGVQKVVETLGDLGSPMLQHEATMATLQIAKALGAEAVFLRTPGVMPTPEMTRAAMADAHIQSALRILDSLDVALVGVGPADFHGPLEEGDNFFTASQLAAVRDAGAVGQLHQRFIDATGKPVETKLNQLVMGITLEQLRNARRKIVVAGGVAKHAAIAAALAGNWIDVLVTDVNTANYLMAHSPKGKS